MRRFGLALAFLMVVALFGSPGRAADEDPCAPAFCERHGAMVEMGDTVNLDASLYLPVESKRLPLPDGLPLIVRQHGGGSNKDNTYDVKWGVEYVKTGKFALLMYSHRGHGKSEGLFDFFGPRTTLDFSEILNWVENGSGYGSVIDTQKVGVSGYSQGGGESLLPAANDARVKAAAVGNTFDDLNHALNPNDCFKFSFATGIFLLAYKSSASRTQDDLAIRWGAQWYTDTEDLPPGDGPVPSTTEDAAARSPLTYVDALKIPVFWSNSWEDQLFPADHPESILSDLKARGYPVHYWFASGGHAALPDDPEDQAGKEAAMRAWMEEFLRGESHGYASGAKPEVDYAQRNITGGESGSEAWHRHTAPAWPVPSTPDTFYARPDGTLGSAEPAPGDLATIVNDLASVNVANDAITYEVLRQVDDGFASNGGPQTGFRNVPGQVPEGANPADTATFTSPVLGAVHNFVGAPVVTIPYRTTAEHVIQFDVKLWAPGTNGPDMVGRGCVSIENPAPEGVANVVLWPNARTYRDVDHVLLTISAVDFPTFKPDVEPHVTTLLAGTRVVLPSVPLLPESTE